MQNKLSLKDLQTSACTAPANFTYYAGDFQGLKWDTLRDKVNKFFREFYANQFNSVTKRLFQSYVYAALSERTVSDRPRYTQWQKGYIQGIFDLHFTEVMTNHVELCYLHEGELYSTQSDTNFNTLQALFDLNMSTGQWDEIPRAFIYKKVDSEGAPIPYDIFSDGKGNTCEEK